jgi:aquaporin Z
LFAGGAYTAQLWLFWIAPILGAMAAGALARALWEPTTTTETIVIEETSAA